MILKQLKQLAFSATRRNADVVRLARFYSSPAVCQQSLTTTTKSYKRLSRDDRRAAVVSFVTQYRAANAGKFPTLKATVKEVGGDYYIVRDILQEIKLQPNAPLPIVATALLQVPASVQNDVTSESLKDADTNPLSHSSGCDAEQISFVVADPVFQDVSDTIDSPHPNSDESNPQGNNNLVITAAHDERETETAPRNNGVDSECEGNTHLPDSQTSMVSEECLKNSETEEEGKVMHLGSQEPKADHLEGADVLPTETRYQDIVITDKSGTETAPPNNDVDSKCDSNTHLLYSQTSVVSEECLKTSETEEEGKLTHLRSQEPKADHVEGADVLPTETRYQDNVITDKSGTETAPPNNDVDSKCDNNTHLLYSQTSVVSEECLKTSETEEEGKLTHLRSQEPKADHLEGADVLPTETRYQDNVITATHDKSGTETASPNNDVDSTCDSNTHLLDSRTSVVSKECLKNSETEEEGKLTHLGSQEQKADNLEGAAVSANVLPTETRQASEKGDGGFKTGENSSAWSNIISFAKEFANFWRKG